MVYDGTNCKGFGGEGPTTKSHNSPQLHARISCRGTINPAESAVRLPLIPRHYRFAPILYSELYIPRVNPAQIISPKKIIIIIPFHLLLSQ